MNIVKKYFYYISLIALFAVGTSLLLTPKVSAGTLEDLREQGYATVAIANEPPYSELTEIGQITGAAPDVARAVLLILGIPELRAEVMLYGDIVDALESREVDLAAAGLYITPQRCAVIRYSEPDLCGAEAFIVKKGNPLGLYTYTDIANNYAAMMTTCEGCAEVGYALERGVEEWQIETMEDAMDGIEMLQDGIVDVFALSGLGISALLKEVNDPNLEIVIPVAGIPMSCGAAAFNYGDKDFRDAYDEALVELKASGKFAEIIEPYGFSAVAADFILRSDFCPYN